MSGPSGDGAGERRTGLRALLGERRPLLATFVMLPRIEIVEMLGAAGFDAVLIDLEHAPVDPGHLPDLVAAAQGAGMHAVARLGSSTEPDVGKALDTGVDGVLVPHVGSPQEASRVVAAGRFPPRGERSLNPYVRGTRYGWGDDAGHRAADERTALIAMIEGAEAVAELDRICAVDGLDAVFVGPVDLSASLGVPGQPEHPRVVEAVGRIFARLADLGVAGGIYAPTVEAANRWFDAGASLVALSADVAMAVRAFAETAGAVVRQAPAGRLAAP